MSKQNVTIDFHIYFICKEITPLPVYTYLWSGIGGAVGVWVEWPLLIG